MAVGVFLGLSSAAAFAVSQVMIRIGMRSRARDDGHFMSVMVNLVVLGPLALLLAPPGLRWPAVVGFAFGGLLTTWLGRSTSYRAVRRIGPARTSAFLISSPLYSSLFGWAVLGERLTFIAGLGGLLVILGLAWLVRSRVAAEPLVDVAEGSAAATIHATAIRQGLVQALLAGFFFGLGFVVRKWALIHYPNAVVGAFIGALSSMVVVVLLRGTSHRLRDLVHDNWHHIPWWFVGAGLFSSVALVSQFAALSRLPAWMVSVLLGTQSIWSLVWGYLFIRQDERIGPSLVLAVLLVASGVSLMVGQL